jgi:hypothetical protein
MKMIFPFLPGSLESGGHCISMVHIVETDNHKGRYVALSHCWGDLKRYPLMSTRATLKDHMSGIAIYSLPLFFRGGISIYHYLDILNVN